jgi:hypothetical protein
MPRSMWFIGSRRRYGWTRPQTPPERLDPAEMHRELDSGGNPARRREYELEVIERVIADVRDPKRYSESE